MDFTRLLLRMNQWVRNPPSPMAVKVTLGVILLAAVIFGIEYTGLWPEWAQVESARRPQIQMQTP